MGRKIINAIISAFSIIPPAEAPARRRLRISVSNIEKQYINTDIGSHFLHTGNLMRRAIDKGLSGEQS